MPGPVRRLQEGARAALTFLTILPIPVPAEGRGAADAPSWFVLVGGLIGGVGAAVVAVLAPPLGATVAAVLAITAMVVLTGAIHLDGLADCADGLGVRGDRARRLTVMRDSAVGTFGALALGAWLLLTVTSVAELKSADAAATLVAAAAVGRWASLLHAVWTPSARPEGLGAAFRVSGVALGAASAAVLLVLPVAGLGPGAAAIGCGLVVAGAVTVWSRSTLGGRTGDTLGAAVALTEAVVCVVLVGVLGGAGA